MDDGGGIRLALPSGPLPSVRPPQFGLICDEYAERACAHTGGARTRLNGPTFSEHAYAGRWGRRMRRRLTQGVPC